LPFARKGTEAAVQNRTRCGAFPALPSPAPSPAAAATSDEAYDSQQYHCADGGVDNRRDNPGTENDSELRQQPASNKRTDNSNNQIADKPKTGPSHDLTGQPAGNETH
jgi:hypothetical protein